MALGTLRPVPVGNLIGELCFVQCFEDSSQAFASHFDVPIHVRSFRFSQIPHANNWHTIIPI